MSKISNAILKTLLEEVTDYAKVNLSKKEMKELKNICDRWEDKSSIEQEINIFLQSHSYVYRWKTFMWEAISF